MKYFKSIKEIKKTRTEKKCSGCGKEISIGSSCLQVYEILEIKYSNEYFCNQNCINIRIEGFFNMIKKSDEFITEMINKTNSGGKKGL